MFTLLDLEVKAPEIHRSTPFEYVLTAEPQQIVEKCTQSVPLAKPRVVEVAIVERIPGLPKWMASSLIEE